MKPTQARLEQIQQLVVTASQMSAIEGRVFEAGMPVAALMEKVAGAIARRIQRLYPDPINVGVLVGPGHNGGDALVVARELFFRGDSVIIWRPLSKSKSLTAQHALYAESLGIEICDGVESLQQCDLLIDGLFGFGLERAMEGQLAEAIAQINRYSIPVVSIDIPSGLHTDTGAVLGTAIRATHTFCLGLWKLAFLQDRALEYLGKPELIDFDLPLADVRAVLAQSLPLRRITPATAMESLPLSRPPTTHKYKQGHLLLLCGSRQYTGAAILAGLGARASGVGMLSIAVPESLKPLVASQLPEALVMGCPETETGAMAQLAPEIQLDRYQTIACGPGLTQEARAVVEAIWNAPCPIVLDADGLNILAQMGTLLPKQPPVIRGDKNGLRSTATIFTPHAGEFARLFPDLADQLENPPMAARAAAQISGAIVLLKGAKVAIGYPKGTVWLNPESTPALARGGTGDVLTGLTGGLVAQAVIQQLSVEPMVLSAAWWHAQAGRLAVQERTELGVDALTLTQYLIPVLNRSI